MLEYLTANLGLGSRWTPRWHSSGPLSVLEEIAPREVLPLPWL